MMLSSFGTWRVQEWRYANIELARIEAEREKKKMDNLAIDKASEAHEITKTLINNKFTVVTETIDNVITKIEYRDRACFDDDGLRAHDSAVFLTGAGPKLKNSLPTPTVP